MKNNEVKKSINEALIELLNKKSYEKISVQEIAQKAFVSRSTFYLYYKNKDSILIELLDNFLHNFDIILKENIYTFKYINMNDQTSIKKILFPYTRRIIENFYENRNLVWALNSPNANILLPRILQEVYYNNFIRGLPKEFYEKIDQNILGYYANFMTNGVAATVESWINEEFKTSVESITDKILNVLSSTLNSIYKDL